MNKSDVFALREKKNVFQNLTVELSGEVSKVLKFCKNINC